MQKKVFQLLVDNTSGVLSRIAGLFSRRGYNIESITAGVTADPRFTRITIVTSGDDDILEQVGKLVDVRDIKELDPDDSVYRELVLVKVKVDPEKRLEIRQGVEFLANNFRAKIIDVGAENLIVEFTGNHSKVNALIQRFTEEYEVLELARTGITGLGRGIENVTYIED